MAQKIKSSKFLKSQFLRTLPRKVRIFEVGPRDGLQAESQTLDLEAKAGLVLRLINSGLSDIEIGSFVRSDKIPQLADTEELLELLHEHHQKELKKINTWAFVPNEVGLERAIKAKVNGASFFIAASDTFCRKNVNRSRSEILESLPTLIKKAQKAKIKTRIYLSTLVYCPYEGAIAPKVILDLVTKLEKLKFTEIVLSDTTGDANPASLAAVLEILKTKYKMGKMKNFALHLHDTRGLALANVLLGLAYGISIFDSSIGGTGGCPYAPGASGNLATEDLANMLLGMGLLQNVNLGLLSEAGFFAEARLGKKLPSRLLRTLESKTV